MPGNSAVLPPGKREPAPPAPGRVAGSWLMPTPPPGRVPAPMPVPTPGRGVLPIPVPTPGRGVLPMPVPTPGRVATFGRLGRVPGVRPGDGLAKSTVPGRLPGLKLGRAGVLGRVETDGRLRLPPEGLGAEGRLIEGPRLIGAEGRDMPPDGRAMPPPPPPTRPPPPPPPRPPRANAEVGATAINAISHTQIACCRFLDMLSNSNRR